MTTEPVQKPDSTVSSVIVSYNIEFLRQGRDLLASISDDAYTHTNSPVYDSGIGEHVRHTLEHYEAFLGGFPERVIDYDARARDERISSDRKSAIRAIDRLVDGLTHIRTIDDPVEIRCAVSPDRTEDDPCSRSTVKRELQYLQAHTVHHFALIAFILRSQGLRVPESFGVAPSTLQHRATLNE